MTTEERKQLRQLLLDKGFKRIGWSTDHGDGAYEESFKRYESNDRVTIQWGPREAGK